MGAGVEYQQGELHVVLLPHQQPVGLYMAFPRVFAGDVLQLMRFVLSRQGAVFGQHVYNIKQILHGLVAAFAEGKGIADGFKSYAVSFILQDKDKTLNDKQIEATMAKI